jgi:phosphate-selective porin OprO/OprP
MTSREWLSRVVCAAAFAACTADRAHAQAAEDPAGEGEPKAPLEYSWRDGKTTLNFAAAEVTVSSRVQVLSVGRHRDGQRTVRSLNIPRARTEIAGWLYSERLSYEAQFDWAEGPELQDLYLALDLLRDGTLEIKAGQFKVPFSRQRLTSSGSQQFVDRAIVVDEFAEGRDIGVQVRGLAADARVEYRAGVFNGAGQNALADVGGLQYNGRVVFQPFGELEYAEGDVGSSESPRLAVAGNVEYNAARNVRADGRRRRVVGADVALHYRGASLLGEVYRRDLSLEAAPTASSTGYMIQAGYFVIPQRLEVAGRLASWDPREPVASAHVLQDVEAGEHEAGLAVGYFLNNHNLKLQSDVRRLGQPGTPQKTYEVRVQLEVVF